MTPQISLVSSDDPRLTPAHLHAALRIAEEAFRTEGDPAQINVGDENVRWTIENIPFCWTLVLVDDVCVGSAAVLPASAATMRRFLSGEIDESAILEIAKRARSAPPRVAAGFRDAEGLYLTGVSIDPFLRKRGFGAAALVHAIRSARAELPSIRELFCWPTTEAGAALVRRIASTHDWNIRERRDP